ncbi:MAG: 5'-methylthioadenosine/adenosylhomocysteine nucleosidase [Rhodospirillales bacterium]|nr:5'-methylthioadenosine/adenosylhomocysteine nucleosidase [Rhodospirillales bacterium]
MLALIGAMEEEVSLLRDEMTMSDQAVHAGITVFRGTFQGVELALAQCGIGKVNATICTQMLVDLYKPDALVFSGVAGGLLANMQVGDLVIASHLIQYDMDLTAFGRRHGEIPGQDRMVESNPALVQKATDAFDLAFDGKDDAPNLMLGTVVSGDRFISDAKTLRWLQREFAALATEMEGAAVGYTCHLNGLPFVVIRGLSDTAGESASNDFETNLHVVCRNSYLLMERLIPLLG